jgi:hypothetical protein
MQRKQCAQRPIAPERRRAPTTVRASGGVRKLWTALALSTAISACMSPESAMEGSPSVEATAAALGAPSQAGVDDGFARGGLTGWTPVGGRRWIESDGFLTTLSPDVARKAPAATKGFLLSEYPSTDDGSFETTLKLDPWNGNAGGLVLRWSSPSSYYFFSLKPGNQWSSKLMFHVNNMDEASGRVIAQNFSVGPEVRMRVTVTGSTFRVFLNDVLAATVNDGANPSGRVGFGYRGDWNNYFSVDAATWTDAPGSRVTVPVDPRAGKVEIKVHVKDEAFGSANLIKPRIYVENTGEVTVSTFDVFYVFKAEPGKVPVLDDYYTPESHPTLLPLGDDEYAVEFRFSGIDLAPGERTPDAQGNVIGIHYADWSPLNKSDDFSNPDSADWAVSNRLPVHGVFNTATRFTDSGTDQYHLVTGTNPTQRVKMKKLSLKRLRCIDITDDDDALIDGWDHVALVVKLDGEYVKTIDAGDMDEHGDQDDDDPKNYWFDGNDGTDNQDLEFMESARVEIYDIENLSISAFDVRLIDLTTTDYIGSHSLDTSIGSHGALRFNRDGKYDLWYEVSEIEVEKSYESLADYHLDKFRNAPEAGVWSKIEKEKLIQSMSQRLADAAQEATTLERFSEDDQVSVGGPDQGSLNYCGPAAVTYLLAKNRPLRYTIFAREMFTKGRFKGAQRTYQASEALRSAKVATKLPLVNIPKGPGAQDYDVRRNEADWLIMSSISDGLRHDINVDDDDEPFVWDGDKKDYKLAGTGNDSMYLWMQDILGYPYVSDDSSVFWGEHGILKAADAAYSRGGAAAFGVESGIFFEGDFPSGFDDVFTVPNHYIAYAGGRSLSPGNWNALDDDRTVKLNVWSWGRFYRKTLSETRFEDSFMGATIAE